MIGFGLEGGAYRGYCEKLDLILIVVWAELRAIVSYPLHVGEMVSNTLRDVPGPSGERGDRVEYMCAEVQVSLYSTPTAVTGQQLATGR